MVPFRRAALYMRRVCMVRRDNTGGRKSTADKRGDHLIEKREREEKRVTGERGGERLQSSMMRGEWGRRRTAWTEERPRGHPQDGWSGRQKESTRGERGGHPRDAQAPCEGGKAGESCSLRPGHLTILRRERSEGDTRRDEARQETHRGRGETGGERKIIERRGRKSVRARRRGAEREKERNPWKSRGERFVAVTDPLAVARARQSTFPARESRRRASQHRTIVARSTR